MVRVWRSVIGLSFLCAATAARAQDACVVDSPEPAELQLTPAPGTPEAVPPDSPIVARFAYDVAVADFESSELLQLTEVAADGGELPVDGRYERFEAQPNVLVFRPTGGLRSDTDYAGTAVDPLDGSSRRLAFGTGARRDERPPTFATNARLSLKAARNASDCQGMRIDVAFTPALDDGPRGSVEHLVFQTRGVDLAVPALRSRVRASMGTEVSTSFVLDDVRAASPLCVAVLPVDGTGRVGDAMGPECFSPDGAARYVGLCSAARGRGPVGRGLLVAGVALGLLWRRLRAHG